MTSTWHDMTASTCRFFFQEWLIAANGFGNKDLTLVQPTIKAKMFFPSTHQKSQVLINFHAPRRSQCLAQGSIWWSCSIVFLVAGVAHREFPPDSIFETMLEKSDTCFVIWFARIMLLWILIRRMWGTCFSVKSSHWTTDFSASVSRWLGNLKHWNEGANLCSLGREGWFSGWEQTFNFQLGVSENWVFFPPNHPWINRVFHYKPSILGYHYCWKPPFGQEKTALSVSFLEGFGTVACGSQSEEDKAENCVKKSCCSQPSSVPNLW